MATSVQYRYLKHTWASEQLLSVSGLLGTVIVKRWQLNTETFELLTLQKVDHDTLEDTSGEEGSADSDIEDTSE